MGPTASPSHPLSLRMGPTASPSLPLSLRMGPTASPSLPSSLRMGPTASPSLPLSLRMGPTASPSHPLSLQSACKQPLPSWKPVNHGISRQFPPHNPAPRLSTRLAYRKNSPFFPSARSKEVKFLSCKPPPPSPCPLRFASRYLQSVITPPPPGAAPNHPADW